MSSASNCGPTNGNSCCGEERLSIDESGATMTHQEVKKFYSAAGTQPQPGLCCPTAYRPEDIAHIPSEVMNVSYGCGSPVLLAGLRPGEVHVDLGSGAGVDCFISAKIIGKDGHVIGVDMTPEMMMRAIKNANAVAKNLGYHNVEFRQGLMEEVPIDTETADLVTSNCVINLSPDKKKVFKEIGRILKSGGRFVISDIVSERPIPPPMQNDKTWWGECMAGALTEEEFFSFAKEAGFYGHQVLSRTFFKEVNGFKFWSLTLRSWKFNKGPSCIYVGQYATYLGPFSQVSDDDGHTYLRGIPFEICTDTALKLSQAPYGGQFLMTEPIKKLDESSVCCALNGTSGKNGCC